MSDIAQTSQPPRPQRILVVDDTEPVRQRLVGMLAHYGYLVKHAADGRTAWDIASRERFDAILLDLIMPTMDGWAFRKVQLDHPVLATVPTIIVTIRPLKEHERYALGNPIVIQKPFEDEAIIVALQRARHGSKEPSSSEVGGARATTLYWSRRGEVACADHAPVTDGTRWIDEAWAAIPARARGHQIRYQCQHCNDGGSAISHER